MNKSELIKLLALEDFSHIYKQAHDVKRDIYADDVYIRCILEFSNYCKADCAYCGLNCKNTNVSRYRMEPEHMVQTANRAWEAGYKTVVLQSGEDPFYTGEMMGQIIREIKRTGIKITLSMGERSYEDYEHWKECGADRYLLKHETADERIYSSLHSYSTWENRISCLRNLKKLGYETGSGFMVGLPSQTTDTIAEDILLLCEIPCDMAGIGPFLPHPDTPLKNLPVGSTEMTKRAVALTRLKMGRINLPATTSLGVINPEEKNNIFSCGANVIMKKVTPDEYKKHYEIYPSTMGQTNIIKDRKELEAQLKALGCTPV